MKILQVIDTLEVGGAEKVYVTMCNILSDNNEDVTSLFLLQGGALRQKLHPHIACIELHRNDKWSIKKMKECAEVIRRFDIIHCHFRHVYRYVSLVNKLFRLNKRIILQDHYGSVNIDNSIPFLFTSLLRPQYYIGVSSSLCDWAVQRLKMGAKSVFLLENIIVKVEAGETISVEYDWVLVSNIKKIKNILFAVQLAKKYQKSLLIIGRIQDEVIFSEIKNFIDGNAITIETEINEVQPELHRANVGLHTSISETGPLVLIEYLAQGIPFLSYETGEVAKILKPHFPEYFIDNFDEEQWINRLNKIENSKADKEKMKKVFEENFGEKRYFLRLKEIYNEI